MMVVLFLGAPGSGKGTQSKIFSADLKIAHLFPMPSFIYSNHKFTDSEFIKKCSKKKKKKGRLKEEYKN